MNEQTNNKCNDKYKLKYNNYFFWAHICKSDMPSTLRLNIMSQIYYQVVHNQDKLELDICIYEIDTYSFAKTVIITINFLILSCCWEGVSMTHNYPITLIYFYHINMLSFSIWLKYNPLVIKHSFNQHSTFILRLNYM